MAEAEGVAAPAGLALLPRAGKSSALSSLCCCRELKAPGAALAAPEAGPVCCPKLPVAAYERAPGVGMEKPLLESEERAGKSLASKSEVAAL